MIGSVRRGYSGHADLDVSCLNRPSDDQTQARIRLETEAIAIIMERVESGQWIHLASDMVLIEIDATEDPQRRRRARSLLPAKIAPLTASTWRRADECQQMGFKPADAVHIAAAEPMASDVLLTCDDRMILAGMRNRAKLHVRIADPLSWLEERENDADA